MSEPTPEQWEYLDSTIIIRAGGDLVIELNRLGAEGWQLVCIERGRDTPDGYDHFYFKRLKTRSPMTGIDTRTFRDT